MRRPPPERAPDESTSFVYRIATEYVALAVLDAYALARTRPVPAEARPAVIARGLDALAFFFHPDYYEERARWMPAVGLLPDAARTAKNARSLRALWKKRKPQVDAYLADGTLPNL